MQNEKAALGARSIPLHFPTPALFIKIIGIMPALFMNLSAPGRAHAKAAKPFRGSAPKPVRSARTPEMCPEFRDACFHHQSERNRL